MTLSPPIPRLWTAGYEPVAADFNTYIRDTMNFLSAATVLRVRQVNAQSIPDNSITGLTLDTVIEDNYSGWDNVNYKYAAQVDGWYIATGNVQLVNGAGAGAIGQASIVVNSVLEVSDTPIAYAAGTNGFPGFWYGYLRGGVDLLHLSILQISGGSLNTAVGSASQCSSLELIWASE